MRTHSEFDELARTAALRLLKNWANRADPTELGDELYEQAEMAGRADICKHLEYDAAGYATEMREALTSLLSEVEGQVGTASRPYPAGSAAASTDRVHLHHPHSAITQCCGTPIINLPSGERWTADRRLVNCAPKPSGGES